MIDAMLAANTETDFVSAVRALDRVLLSGDYVVPLFYTPRQWVAVLGAPQASRKDTAIRVFGRHLVGRKQMTLPSDKPFNMADYCIGQAARSVPSKIALLVYEVHRPDEPAETWTFAELEDAVQRLAAASGRERIEARRPGSDPPW